VVACSVVTVEAAAGSQAQEVAKLAAQQLGFRYVDDQIVAVAASRAGVGRRELERAGTSTAILRRLLAALTEALTWTSGPGLYAYAVPGHAQKLSSPPQASREARHRSLIQEAIFEVAHGGDTVILGHGANILLAGTTGVLRVFITGSPRVRVHRYAGAEKLAESKATGRVARADRGRQGYLRRLYGVDEELPSHYDLIISTDVLSPQSAALIVAQAARALEYT
jgi:cytidylate kinase